MLFNITKISNFTFENHSTSENETCESFVSIGATFSLLFVPGLVLNIALLALIYRSREVKETRNLYLIALLLLNIINGSMDFPLLILRNFTCK